LTTQSALKLRIANKEDNLVLGKVIQFAYRGGKPRRSWTNEDQVVAGIRTTDEELASLLASPEKVIIVAEMGEDIVGCVLVEKEADAAIIGMLAVDPERQSFGIGKTLLTAAEKHAREDFGCTTSIMTILCGRDELLAWYMRAGYSDTGKTKPFPKDTGAIELVSGLYFQVLSKNLVDEAQDMVGQDMGNKFRPSD
jgi:GNAT superfamily N-acetyltransferase